MTSWATVRSSSEPPSVERPFGSTLPRESSSPPPGDSLSPDSPEGPPLRALSCSATGGWVLRERQTVYTGHGGAGSLPFGPLCLMGLQLVRSRRIQ